MPDFIEVDPDALDAALCRGIIERFEASGQATRGRTGIRRMTPADFTRPRQSNRPGGGDKYIATSWVQFSRAESLYGKA